MKRGILNFNFFQVVFTNVQTLFLRFQVEEDSQLSKSTQTEQDQYEMNVRAANIVSYRQNITNTLTFLCEFP